MDASVVTNQVFCINTYLEVRNGGGHDFRLNAEPWIGDILLWPAVTLYENHTGGGMILRRSV